MAISTSDTKNPELCLNSKLNEIQVTLTDRELGRGSYSTVVEVEYSGLKCAAKIIHKALYECDVTSTIQRRFEEECYLLSQMRHPNVVQFLGICYQHPIPVPILVMEYLPTNLTSCIDHYGVVPEEIIYSILLDVSLGLNYLHTKTPPIIHRDLSSNNILLTPDMMAKISDLGLAKILNLTPLQKSQMTQNPGTPAYMPPEVMLADPKYSMGVDIFSYGVMMIHMLSGKWPLPNCEPVLVGADGQLVAVSEADRRKQYLLDIGNHHPLMELILECINNDFHQRACIAEIVDRMKEMVLCFSPSFTSKLEMICQIEALKDEKIVLVAESERKDRVAKNYADHVKQLEQKLLSCKDNHQREKDQLELAHSIEVEQLHSRLQDVNAQIDMLNSENKTFESEKESYRQTFVSQEKLFGEAIETEKESHQKDIANYTSIQQALQKEIHTLHSQLATVSSEVDELKLALRIQECKKNEMSTSLKLKDSEINSKKTALEQMDASICLLNDQLEKARKYLSSNIQPLQSRISWNACSPLPIPASLGKTVVISNMVYFGGFVTDDDENENVVYCYNPSQDNWISLPPLPVRWFGLGQVDGKLIAVGGVTNSNYKVTNDVYVYQDRSRNWKKSLPPLLTARYSANVISHNSLLIVAGGWSSSEVDVDTVEILKSSHWYKVAGSHPTPCCSAVTQNTCYLVGDIRSPGKVNRVVSASIDQFLYNATSAPQSHQTSQDEPVHAQVHASMWKELANTPTYRPSIAAILGKVLAIGGNKSDCGDRNQDEIQKSVHIYSPSTDLWVYIGDLPSPREEATSIALSSTEVLVIGGRDESNKTSTVYKGTLNIAV